MISTERDPQAPSKLAIKQVAETWSEGSLNYSQTSEYLRYDEMSHEFLSRVKAIVTENSSEEAPGQLVESLAAHSGFNVVGRFLYAGTIHAVNKGFSQDELKAMLYLPESFRSLQQITREKNATAISIEYELGLNGIVYPRDSRILKGFSLNENVGLIIKDYPLVSYRARSILVDQGKISMEEAYDPDQKDTVRCLAHAAGMLGYVYKYMLDVVDKDPNLFEQTFARSKE